MVLTALTSLSLLMSHIWSGYQVAPNWQMPALRFLKLFRIREAVVLRRFNFLDRCGHQLIGLHIRSDGVLAPESFRSILSRMASLQSIVVDEVDLNSLREVGVSYPSILHMGLQLRDLNNAGFYTIHHITEDLRAILTNRVLPGLRSVNLLAVESEGSIDVCWSELLAVCRSKKVTLGGKQ